MGRRDELVQLVAALEESAYDARFVVLEGEPGIGKTRLADELRSIAAERGSLAVWGRSDEGGAAPALWPWLPPLRALTAQVATEPAALTELFAGDAPAVVAGSGAAGQFERFEAVAEVLERAGSTTPAVVLLDDLQWADATSLELLGFLCGRLARGVLVVATIRQLEVGRNDAATDALAAMARRPSSRRLVLRGLTPDATAAMLNTTARTLTPAVVAAIHDRAEGNPFYAIELARLVDEEGGLDGEVPGTVGDVIRRRLAQLPTATIELLGVGAVIGRDIDLALLARGAEIDLAQCLDMIEPAVVHRLLVDLPEQPGMLRFSHALVREVLLTGLTSLRRARLHLRVADAIEGTGAGLDETEILAEHLWRAAPVGVGQRAAVALEQAAQVAARRVSYAAAEDHLAKAVRLRRASGSSPADQEAELRTIYRLLEITQATRYFQGADRRVLARGKELAERFGQRDTLRKLLWFEWAALATSCQLGTAARSATTGGRVRG